MPRSRKKVEEETTEQLNNVEESSEQSFTEEDTLDLEEVPQVSRRRRRFWGHDQKVFAASPGAAASKIGNKIIKKEKKSQIGEMTVTVQEMLPGKQLGKPFKYNIKRRRYTKTELDKLKGNPRTEKLQFTIERKAVTV